MSTQNLQVSIIRLFILENSARNKFFLNLNQLDYLLEIMAKKITRSTNEQCSRHYGNGNY